MCYRLSRSVTQHNVTQSQSLIERSHLYAWSWCKLKSCCCMKINESLFPTFGHHERSKGSSHLLRHLWKASHEYQVIVHTMIMGNLSFGSVMSCIYTLYFPSQTPKDEDSIVVSWDLSVATCLWKSFKMHGLWYFQKNLYCSRIVHDESVCSGVCWVFLHLSLIN